MEWDWEKLATAILAVGALGTAAFGVVEAFGKAIVIRRWGLPFVGFGCVTALIHEYGPALRFTYGPKYELILAQQYRDGRAAGRAPETIRNGVRLALPLIAREEALRIVENGWGMAPQQSQALVGALQAEAAHGEELDEKAATDAAVLAGRFGVALDSRIAAAFTLAEERYQATARLLAGISAIGLSVLFNLGLRGAEVTCTAGGACTLGDPAKGYSWFIALLIGAAAVPLAPVAKDLSSALTEALRAWKQVGAAAKG